MNFIPVILLMFQITGGNEPSASNPWQDIALEKVSGIDLPTSTLSGNWKSIAGLRIDDFSKTNALSEDALAVAKQLTPIGVKSAAEYSLSRQGFPLNTVSVRLFVFQDVEKCRSWWNKKYGYEGWKEHYTKIDCKNAVAVRSLQANKSAIAFGRVWLTTSQIQKGNQHIAAANHILNRLTQGKMRFPGEEQ